LIRSRLAFAREQGNYQGHRRQAFRNFTVLHDNSFLIDLMLIDIGSS
jgi:hypothetical protein